MNVSVIVKDDHEAKNVAKALTELGVTVTLVSPVLGMITCSLPSGITIDSLKKIEGVMFVEKEQTAVTSKTHPAAVCRMPV